MTLSQRTCVTEIITQWSFRFPMLVRIPIRKVSFPKQSGTGMPSLIHSSPLLNCRTIAYLNSLSLLELGTNLPRPCPDEVLSFLAFNQLTILILKPQFYYRKWGVRVPTLHGHACMMNRKAFERNGKCSHII